MQDIKLSPDVLFSNSVFRSQTHFCSRQKTIGLCSASMTSSFSRRISRWDFKRYGKPENKGEVSPLWFTLSSVVWMRSPLGQQLYQLDIRLTLHAHTHTQIGFNKRQQNRSTGCYDNVFSSWTHYVNNNMAWCCCWLQTMTKTCRLFLNILRKDRGMFYLAQKDS